jgi:hypothetical protein
MYISSGQKLAILGVLLAGGAAAFVYLDPLDLDLLGLKPPPVATPVAPPRPAAPKPATPAIPATPANPGAAAPPAAPAVPVISGDTGATPETPPPAAEQKLQFVPVLSQKPKPATKPVSPPSVDLRHCLEQTTNEAIAKCAGE